MTREIECPHCNETVEVTEDVSDFDWNSGVSLNGIARIACPYCHKDVTVEATAMILGVEVVDD